MTRKSAHWILEGRFIDVGINVFSKKTIKNIQIGPERFPMKDKKSARFSARKRGEFMLTEEEKIFAKKCGNFSYRRYSNREQ